MRESVKRISIIFSCLSRDYISRVLESMVGIELATVGLPSSVPFVEEFWFTSPLSVVKTLTTAASCKNNSPEF